MKKLMLSLIAGLSLMASTTQAYIDWNEQQAFLAKVGPLPAEVQRSIDARFPTNKSDLEVDALNWLLFDRSFLFIRGFAWRHGALQKEEKQKMIPMHQFAMSKVPEIAAQKNLNVLNAQNSLVLQLRDLPNYVLHCSVYEWDSLYQNISRVFYNEKIRDFVAAQGLEHIATVKMWFYNIPGRTPFNLTDLSYTVVAENLHTKFQPGISWKEFVQRLNADNDEAHTILEELIRTLTYVALADIGETNIQLVHDRGVLKVLFIDTEQPGIGGAEDETFFQKSSFRVQHNATAAINNLYENILKKYGYTGPKPD